MIVEGAIGRAACGDTFHGWISPVPFQGPRVNESGKGTGDQKLPLSDDLRHRLTEASLLLIIGSGATDLGVERADTGSDIKQLVKRQVRIGRSSGRRIVPVRMKGREAYCFIACQELLCGRRQILLPCCVKLLRCQDAHCCSEGDAPNLVVSSARSFNTACGTLGDGTGKSHLRSKGPNGIAHVSRAVV